MKTKSMKINLKNVIEVDGSKKKKNNKLRSKKKWSKRKLVKRQ